MKRWRAAATLMAVLVIAVALPARGEIREYADDFSSGGYAGSSGPHAWESTWLEDGESDGPSSGAVQVRDAEVCDAGRCLVVQPLVGTGMFGAQRRVDMVDVAAASLSWHVDFAGVLVLGTAVVEASPDGGGWVRLAAHAPDTEGSFTASLPAATEYVDIRVRSSGLSVGSSLGFDSFVVETEMIEPTTTTTSSTTSTTSSTTSTTTSTTTTVPDRDSTTTTSAAATTSTTRPPATTTTVPNQESTTTTARDATTTTTTQGPSATPDPSDGESAVPRPSPTSGVVTDLSAGVSDPPPLDLTAQDRLLVRFLRVTEDLRFDILLNVALGVVLAWASVTMMPKR